jgi:hypothetical protein
MTTGPDPGPATPRPHCPRCGVELAKGAPPGLCAACSGAGGEPARSWSRLWAALPVLLALILLALWLLFAPR